jgi:type I restriction enzyme S subunit
MKLRKDKWKEVELSSIALKLTDGAHNVPKEQQVGLPMISARDIQNYKIDLSNPRYISKEDFIKESKRTNVQPNDILLTIVGTIGRCAIIPNNFPQFTLQRSVAVISTTENPNFILTYFDSPNFQNQLLKKAIGTAQKGVYLKSLANTKIILPPLEEQKQIASLFQSIETAMEQVEGQEKNLHQLKHKLLRDLFSEKQEFGNCLKEKDFEKVRFDKIAMNISERVEPKKTELTTYVGLEHLDADNLKIERTGIPDDVIGTKLKIYKGDIIFGKRRAYLRKVAVSHFDGIASAHSMILRANEKNIEKDFLPYFMQSDTFMSRAVQISEGSLSPTIKNKTLAIQEFILPKKEKQKELICVFKQYDNTVNELKKQKATLKNLKQKLLNEILG